MKIAVTGASGHIGNVLVHDLLSDGHEVKVLSHRYPFLPKSLPVEQVKGGLNDTGAIRTLLSGVDAVIHAAALISINGGQNGELRSVNVEGTRMLLEESWKLNIKKVVHVSSIHAYLQFPENISLNENRVHTNNAAPAYDQSKRDGQQIALSYARKGLNISIVNPTSIVGPPDYRPSLMGQAIINLCNGKIPALIRGGFDFVDVRDVSKGILGALQYGRNGECYLLAGKWLSITEIAKMLSSVSGRKIAPPLIPVWMARVGVPFIKMGAVLTGTAPLYTNESIDALVSGNRNIDASKAKNELQFSSRPFEVTLHDTFKWFKKHGYIKK